MTEVKPFNPEYAREENHCPWCGNDDFDIEYEEYDDGLVRIGCSCDVCDGVWGEQFELRYRYSRPGAEHEVDFKESP